MNKDKIGTLGVHAGYEPENGGPRQIPIIQSTTWKKLDTSTPACRTPQTTT